MMWHMFARARGELDMRVRLVASSPARPPPGGAAGPRAWVYDARGELDMLIRLAASSPAGPPIDGPATGWGLHQAFTGTSRVRKRSCKGVGMGVGI